LAHSRVFTQSRRKEGPYLRRLFSEHLFVSKGLFEASQLTGEKKPAFGSVDETLAVRLVLAGVCRLHFGNRAALCRCKKQHMHPIHPARRALCSGSTKVCLVKTGQ
jgi:hypothetical protein